MVSRSSLRGKENKIKMAFLFLGESVTFFWRGPHRKVDLGINSRRGGVSLAITGTTQKEEDYRGYGIDAPYHSEEGIRGKGLLTLSKNLLTSMNE